jgi:ribose-phosphate pyrophosphokinase
MRLFALGSSHALGTSVAASLTRDLDRLEERDFEDGEHKARPLVSVRGQDVFVIATLAAEADATPNDQLVKLLFFLAACRENGAARLTAVVPYLCYARKDRQTKRRDPVSVRYVAQLFEAVGTDRVVTLDIHNLAAFQNAFRCETVHLEARLLFVERLRSLAAGRPVTVFSPDSGGVKRAELLRQSFEATTGVPAAFGFMEKQRSRGVVSGSLFAGAVEGSAVFIIDDMISSGGTMVRAARACRERGAAAVFVVASHGLFGKGSEGLLNEPTVDRIIVTDSLSAATRQVSERLEIVSIGELLGGAIDRLARSEALGDLMALED